ncbi:MAG: hypothetical protein HYX34_13260 [Actinobacteria bacterium]|nr:hypothetical protein [Actinomycetota bacterium]
MVRFRTCGTGLVDSLAVRRSGDGRVVWTARRRAGARGALEIPIAATVEGYRVADRTGGRLEPGRRYSVDARSTTGARWGGPGFDPADLRPGRVRVAGRDLAYARWAGAPPSCPDVGAGRIVLGVAAVGGAGALLAIALRLTIAAAARRAGVTEPEVPRRRGRRLPGER